MANIKFKLISVCPSEISRRVEELYFKGMSYKEALEQAQKEYEVVTK